MATKKKHANDPRLAAARAEAEYIAEKEREYAAGSRAEAQKAAPRPLLPERWWENASSPMMAGAPSLQFVLSPQIAEVLMIGIDRVVDIATRREKDLEFVQQRLNSYTNHYDRLLQFLENASDRLTVASPAEAVNEGIVAVRSAIQTIIEEPRP